MSCHCSSMAVDAWLSERAAAVAPAVSLLALSEKSGLSCAECGGSSGARVEGGAGMTAAACWDGESELAAPAARLAGPSVRLLAELLRGMLGALARFVRAAGFEVGMAASPMSVRWWRSRLLEASMCSVPASSDALRLPRDRRREAVLDALEEAEAAFCSECSRSLCMRSSARLEPELRAEKEPPDAELMLAPALRVTVTDAGEYGWLRTPCSALRRVTLGDAALANDAVAEAVSARGRTKGEELALEQAEAPPLSLAVEWRDNERKLIPGETSGERCRDAVCAWPAAGGSRSLGVDSLALLLASEALASACALAAAAAAITCRLKLSGASLRRGESGESDAEARSCDRSNAAMLTNEERRSEPPLSNSDWRVCCSAASEARASRGAR